MNLSNSRREYRRQIFWKRAILLCAIVAAPTALAISVSLGVVRIPLGEIVAILLGRTTDGPNEAIVLSSRLPQALTAFLAGAGLASIGAAMQATLRNPLSSPFTLGVSSAAAFGAACVVVLGAGRFAAFDAASARVGIPCASVSLGAFASSLLATAPILFLSGRSRVKTETIVLIGVALSSFFGAGIMLLQYVAEEQQLAALVYWTFGDAARGTWPIVAALGVLVPALGFWHWTQSWNYNALALGEETARGLGVSVFRVRTATMFFASLATSVLVASIGIVGFVGLVVPHLARLLVGADNRYSGPTAFFLGGILLLVSDAAARLVLAPRLMPVSILTAFVGAPVFLFMLLKRNELEG